MKYVNFFDNHCILVLNHPACSPDLNLIEHVWFMIERKMSNYIFSNFLNNKIHYFNEIKEFANDITIESTKKLINNMLKIREEVYQRRGKNSSY